MLVGLVCIRMGLGDVQHRHRRRRRQPQPKRGLSGNKEADGMLDKFGKMDWGLRDNFN